MKPSVSPAPMRAGSAASSPRLTDMPTAMKNKSKQQAFEGLDVCLELMTELAVGEQHAGKKGAEGHGETPRLPHQRDADDGEQRAGRDRLARSDSGDDALASAAISRPPTITMAMDHGIAADLRSMAGSRREREQRHDGEHGNDGEVLEQQYSKGEPAVAGG